jgi:hypothetical protein
MRFMTAPSTYQPKTLTEARQLIESLKEKLNLTRSESHSPIPEARAALHPQLASQQTGTDLSALTPRGLKDFFENATAADLRQALGRECSKGRRDQDPAVIASLYKELKRRGRR